MNGPKVALITGAGKRRLGWHVADALASAGYALAIHYRSSKAEAESAVEHFTSRGVSAIAVAADLTDESAVHSLVDRTLDRFGRMDVLVHCAGIWERKPFEEITAADVRRHLEINTLGTFLCCQQVGLAMARQPQGGSIVTIGDWAIERPYLNYAAYFPSKGAIPALTRCLAVELAARNPNVRVNCILPGPVMLPDDLPLDEREEAISSTLVHREGRPQNIAQTVLFFCENDFVTGVCLPIDGGRTIFPTTFDRRS
jgi:pteridine reductase